MSSRSSSHASSRPQGVHKKRAPPVKKAQHQRQARPVKKVQPQKPTPPVTRVHHPAGHYIYVVPFDLHQDEMPLAGEDYIPKKKHPKTPGQMSYRHRINHLPTAKERLKLEHEAADEKALRQTYIRAVETNPQYEDRIRKDRAHMRDCVARNKCGKCNLPGIAAEVPPSQMPSPYDWPVPKEVCQKLTMQMEILGCEIHRLDQVLKHCPFSKDYFCATRVRPVVNLKTPDQQMQVQNAGRFDAPAPALAAAHQAPHALPAAGLSRNPGNNQPAAQLPSQAPADQPAACPVMEVGQNMQLKNSKQHFGNNSKENFGNNSNQRFGNNNNQLVGREINQFDIHQFNINWFEPVDHSHPPPDIGAGQGQNMPGVFYNNFQPLQTEFQRSANNNDRQVFPVYHPPSPIQAVESDNAIEEMFRDVSAGQPYICGQPSSSIQPSPAIQAAASANAMEETVQGLSADQGYGYQPYMQSQLPNLTTYATTQQQQQGVEGDQSAGGGMDADPSFDQIVNWDVDLAGNNNNRNQPVGGDQQPQQQVGNNDNDDNNNQPKPEPEPVAQQPSPQLPGGPGGLVESEQQTADDQNRLDFELLSALLEALRD